jgi:hypothetical protein
MRYLGGGIGHFNGSLPVDQSMESYGKYLRGMYH